MYQSSYRHVAAPGTAIRNDSVYAKGLLAQRIKTMKGMSEKFE